MDIDTTTAVVIRYTNYRGETSDRKIVPKSIRFASTEWHPEPQWLLDAFDLEKQADRSFAMKDIHQWGV
jgi:predicted DNA-binding transcriptional regulator YafY